MVAMSDSLGATARRAEPWVVAFVAVHSATIGGALILAPEWSANLAGFGTVEARFFLRQAGVFHLVLACGYAAEFATFRGVRLLLAAKGAATAFLVAAWLGGESAWSVPFSAATDFVMGVSVLGLHAAARSRPHPP